MSDTDRTGGERDIVARLRADERYGDLDLYHEAAAEIQRADALRLLASQPRVAP